MFIKLTRFDNTPIWFNAAYVVTVEPRRRGGGSVVVPIGDGLDYDVKESPETVLDMLKDAPMPVAIPVHSPSGLGPTQLDVSPDPEGDEAVVEVEPSAAKMREPYPEQTLIPVPTPAQPASASTDEKKPEPEKATAVQEKAEEPAAETETAPEKAEAKPAAKATRTRRKTKAAGTAASAAEGGTSAPKKTRTARKPKAPKLDLSDEQVERLRKMAPGSVKKLQNTLTTQFKVADAAATVTALEAKGVLSLDREHVVWAQG